ncbi:hypothetical protein [Microbacterium xylanilyticum]
MTSTTTARTQRRRVRSTVLTWACGTVAALALLIGAVALFAPSTAEYVYGQAKTGAQSAIGQALAPIVDATPTIRLGGTGDRASLNDCDGSFTGMTSYGSEIPTVYAAHNNCGGDVLLPWQLGQRVNVVDESGTTRAYTVIDIRTVPKTWGTVQDLVGIKGAFALQTCFYGENLMKFVGLTLAT